MLTTPSRHCRLPVLDLVLQQVYPYLQCSLERIDAKCLYLIHSFLSREYVHSLRVLGSLSQGISLSS